MLRLVAGKKHQDKDLAGKSTLNRLELGTGTANRYKKINFWRDAVDRKMPVENFLSAAQVADAVVALLKMDASVVPQELVLRAIEDRDFAS